MVTHRTSCDARWHLHLRPDDVGAMQTVVGDLVNGAISGSPRDPGVVAEFAYENLCARVADLLEQIAD